MSYCEDYSDPFDRNPDDDEDESRENEFQDEENWTCLYPGKCLMPSMHCRDECHTEEDLEAYYMDILADEYSAP